MGLGGSLVAPALYNFVGSIGGLFVRVCYRDELKQRIVYSRLGKMLMLRGIDLQYYLFSQSSLIVENQVRKCESCSRFYLCDYFIGNGTSVRDDDLDFCRINDSVRDVKQQQDKLFASGETKS